VEILIGPGLAGYRVTVRRALWGKLTQALKLTEAANYADPTSAVVVAGRLVREEIPCVIIGRTRNRLGRFGIAGMSTIAVPHTFLTRAERVLNASDISEAELTKLALRTAVDHEDPPA
jgi:hypothetical protein